MMKWKVLWLPCCILVGQFFVMMGTLIGSGLNDRLGKADLALVLGNKVELDGTPSHRLRARLDKAIELYRAGYFAKILVSGGIGQEGFDEAKVMGEYLMANGISSENILLDNAGITTYASAKNTRKILDQQNLRGVFVITQYYHIPRARLALENFGISPIYSAHADFYEGRDIYSSIREVIAYGKYMFLSYDNLCS
jgi:vancomycin permeability regulator SanA